ncbi:hypothetical protein K431DRAFT_231689 [Polychaeton citri CBS 116435]|uniref:ARM repeat-containing protein n=1 Tax=Polychaeton citri CBS 116435 TaxID=1314669 RepID=A0A9P4Q013_9PEZI|nr:hypothetical protein K431DRAFT_231689 [Polychaeton citri CBS 116435]
MQAEDGAQVQTLQFDQPLTWKAGRSIAVSDLLRRLRELYEELSQIEQDDADRESLVPKAQELASTQLTGHRDRGVKAWTLLNIVEMFRLLAPDAPYKQSQLKQIFGVFINEVVPAMANPGDPYNEQHVGVLDSLTSIKSIILLTDISDSDDLISKLFQNCFDMLGGEKAESEGESLPKNVEYHVANMLCTLVDECAQLPDEVVLNILAQFLRADPVVMGGMRNEDVDVELFEANPAYNMARSICNTCSEKMSRAIGNYFSSVLMEASESFSTNKTGPKRGKKRTHDESEDDSDEDIKIQPAEHDLQKVEQAHRMLRELWRSSPDVVQNIMQPIETELSAENTHLRTLAVQTVGDMVAGIGAAGLPQVALLDPEAYPSQSVDPSSTSLRVANPLLRPNAPHSFHSVHPGAYQAFLDRRRDRAAQVRSAWTMEAGRIIATAGGGKGLDADQERTLLKQLADMLVDTDERVRLAAVEAIDGFSFETIMVRVGSNGSVNTPNSILSNLADRIKDPKRPVRIAAMELLGRIWGVAVGAIVSGSERTEEVLGSIPSRIMSAWYVNNPEIHALISKVTYESLLPVRYPPLKKTDKSTTNGLAKSKDVQSGQSQGMESEHDPNVLRVERILTLVRSLEPKSKTVFFALVGQRQIAIAKYLEAYLKACEDWQSGNSDRNQKETEKKLEGLIDLISKMTLDPLSASEHLKKYAKANDRRSHQLIRFCYDSSSEYRKVANAQSNLRKNVAALPGNMDACLETLLPLVRTASILVYNKSHVPAIVSISRSDDKGLSQAAHEVLKEISARAPAIFKAHVLELCQALTRSPPSESQENDEGDVDTLKACADFARKFPNDMPTKDRKFYQALNAFALQGKPPLSAKHAVTIIVESAEKKEMYISQLLETCVNDFEYGKGNFLPKLATLSQLRLLANSESGEFSDEIMDIAVSKVLSEPHVDPDTATTGVQWEEQIDSHLAAKVWALKILVNGLRGHPGRSGEDQAAASALRSNSIQVFRLLNTLIERDGELSKTAKTPDHHKSRLRLTAAVLLLKLCSSGKVLNDMLGPRDFNRLAKTAQDPLPEVRAGFSKCLKKYLGRGRLPSRFFALVLIYAYEPNKETKEGIITWLRSRAAVARQSKELLMESVFARFMSLLAHHQDFSTDPEDILEFVEYIVFYLRNVATESNIPLIYYIAQRLKTVADGIDPDFSERLYILSDLADAVVRQFCESQGWSLQLYPGKLAMPKGIFQALSSHEVAQEISEKRHLPEDVVDHLEDRVKNALRTKKRKTESKQERATKKPKSSVDDEDRAPKKISNKGIREKRARKTAKTPRKKLIEDSIPSSERRKSTRQSSTKNYTEMDTSDEEAEMQDWDEEAEKENMDVDVDDVPTSTPPTSDPVRATEPVKPQPRPAETTRHQKSERAKAQTPKQMPTRRRMPRRAARSAVRTTTANDESDIPNESASE